MSSRSGIEWTDATWNPVTGCTKVSPGCEHCYAERITERFGGDFSTVTCHQDRLGTPLRWRKPRRVFVNSMSDLFHPDVPDEFIAKVFAVMAATPQHTYQILTKRHARMRSLLRDECRCGHGHGPGIHFRSAMAWAASKANPDRIPELPGDGEHQVYFDAGWPLPNVWLGVSAEDQKWADIRVPALLDTPAAVRFVSAEPLLGPVDLSRYLGLEWMDALDGYGPEMLAAINGRIGPDAGLHWIIAGGESGPGARPMHPDWARSLRDQCDAAGTAFFFKQWGEWAPAPWVVRVCDPAAGWQGTAQELETAKTEAERVGATHALMPSGHLYEPPHKPWSIERQGHQPGAVRRYGKRRAGRELDGRTWDQYPEGSHA